MFTGLVTCIGTMASRTPKVSGFDLAISTSRSFAEDLILGESIAVNGCCLTVTGVASNMIHFDCSPETLALTNLDRLTPDVDTSQVNLERALRASDRMGGHLVSGHVDALGQIVALESVGDFLQVSIEIPWDAPQTYVVDKGSITINGVSLTINKWQRNLSTLRLEVMLIPQTIAKTNFAMITVGQYVNIEFDMLAKMVQAAVHPYLSQVQCDMTGQMQKLGAD